VAVIVALFSVQDPEAFRAFHLDNEESRQRFGCTAARVYRDRRDPNMLLTVLEFPSAAVGERYVESVVEAGGVEAATLEGIPRIEIYEDAW